jgi:putative ABC transport system substrate-binding protein
VRRRAAVLALSAAALPWRTAIAQDRKRNVRIGVLIPNAPVFLPRFEAFRQGMRDLGYVEGANVVYEYRDADGKVERLAPLALELVRARVDLVFTASDTAVLAAMRATSTIPIVFGAAADPVAAGVADSLGRPGRNATGLSVQAPELARKRLELLKDIVPGLARVGFVWSPNTAGMGQELREVEAAARELSLGMESLAIRAPADVDRVLTSPHDTRRAQALLTAPHPLINALGRSIVAFANRNRLPVMYAAPEHVRELGGLITYAPSYAALWRRAAMLAHRILSGAKPAQLPIEQPTEFDLVINRSAAAAIGLAIPAAIQARITE